MKIPYTICFCCYQQQVLMLYRTHPPNARLWNGLGGKIETGETPLTSVQREMLEEASIDLRDASSLFFAGISTWGLAGREPISGMYVFIAHLSQEQAERITSIQTSEGTITWKPLTWVCDPHNQTVVNNIPLFLPPMLQAEAPFEYFYAYEREDAPVETFRELLIRPLPSILG